MIFAFFCLQSISIAFGTVTKVHDIENLISSYLSHTIDQHALYATSYNYMQIVQDESNLTPRYLQSIRYILHGFPIANGTNDNENTYKKLNFIQSIAYYYCGISMSRVMSTSLDNILINQSQLYMNSTIFPVQVVESYEFIRFEICERIKLGLYESVVDMFKPDMHVQSTQRNPVILQLNSNVNADSSFSRFIGNVADFISLNTHASDSLQSIDQMYQFLVKFGEFESYKEAVVRQIWQIDNSLALQSNPFTSATYDEIAICVHQIKHPKMHKYVTNTLKQQVKSTGNRSFILDHDIDHGKTEDMFSRDFLHYARIYQFLTNSVAADYDVEHNEVEVHNMFELLHECYREYATIFRSTSSTMVDCVLIVFGVYESCNDDINGHEYVLDAIKCIISNHQLYCSTFAPLANETDYERSSSIFLALRKDLRESLSEAVFYPYIHELMNDTQFVNIVNNNTNFEIDTYLQTIFSNLMMLALDEYKDIEMIKKIATEFKPKINVCRNCILENKYKWDALMISWMDVLIKQKFIYLTKYFQQRFKHQTNTNCTQISIH